MAAKPPLIPVLHRSESLLVRVAKQHHLSFAVRGQEVEFFAPDRLRAIAVVPVQREAGRTDEAMVELHGAFKGATAYGSNPAVRSVGPIPRGDAEAALADLNHRLELPKPLHAVTMDELEQDPAAYADRWIDVVVRWQRGFESSNCGVKTHVWLDAPEALDRTGDETLVRVVGIFRHTGPGPGMGFGHMGAARSAIQASSVEPACDLLVSGVRRRAETVESLVAAIGSDDAKVRLRAIARLGTLGAEAQPATVTLLELFSREVSHDELRAALRTLGAIAWGPHRSRAVAVLCGLAKFAIVHAGGLRAVSALRRWYPEGPDFVTYREGGMPRFLDGHDLATDLLATLTSQQVVPEPIDVALQWLHPNGLDEGRPGRRWAEQLLRSGALSNEDQRRIRSALATAAQQAAEKAAGGLPPQTVGGLPERPTDARKPFVLDGRRIDFEPNSARTHHRITVDETPVRMIYEEITSGITNSGSYAPRVRMAAQPMSWLALQDLLESPAPFTSPAPRQAVCAWTPEPGLCQGTVIYSAYETRLTFADDWSTVEVSWRSWTDTSS